MSLVRRIAPFALVLLYAFPITADNFKLTRFTGNLPDLISYYYILIQHRILP